MVPFTVVEGPEAWTAADYTNTDDYIYHFSAADLAELEAAVAAALQQGKDIKVRKIFLSCWLHLTRPLHVISWYQCIETS